MGAQTQLGLRRCLLAMGALGLAVVTASAAHGADFSPYVAAGIVHTDNFDRTITDAVSESRLAGELGARYVRESTRSTIDLDGAVTGLHYDQSRADDETRARLDAVLLFDLVPERAVLMVLDRYGQIAAGSYGALNPSNRENVNYASAGPRIALPIGRATAFELAALAGRSDYEVSDVGANRWSAQAALTNRISALRSVSLNVLQSDTRFRELAGHPQLTSRSGFLRFESLARRSSFGIEAGYAHVDNDITSKGDPMFAASLAVRAGAYTEVSFDASHGFRDAISSFLLSENLAGLGDFNVDRNVLAVDDFGRSTAIGTSVRVVRERTTFSIAGSWSSDRYLTRNDLDRKVLGVDLQLARELGARTVARLTGAFYREEDAAGAVSSRLVTGGLGLSYQATERLSLDLSGQSFRFSSPVGSLTETRGSLNLRYALTRPGTAAEFGETSPLRTRLPDDLLDLQRNRIGD